MYKCKCNMIIWRVNTKNKAIFFLYVKRRNVQVVRLRIINERTTRFDDFDLIQRPITNHVKIRKCVNCEKFTNWHTVTLDSYIEFYPQWSAFATKLDYGDEKEFFGRGSKDFDKDILEKVCNIYLRRRLKCCKTLSVSSKTIYIEE